MAGRIGWVVAIGIGVAGAWWVASSVSEWRMAGNSLQPDPLIESASKSSGRHFGGIERWVYPGMKATDATGLLQLAGYRCQLPEDPKTGGQPGPGEHDVVCAANGFWRTSVALRLRYQHGQPPRLVAAAAASEGSRRGAALLRLVGLRPRSETVLAGWSPDTPAHLAALLHDRATPDGWWRRCGHDGIASGDRACVGMYQLRTEQVLQPRNLAEPLVAGHVCSYAQALAELGFVPATPRADAPRDLPWQQRAPLAVEERADGSWRALSHWQGRDLQGQPWRATLVLAPVGARVEAVDLQVGGATQRFAVDPGQVRALGCNGRDVLAQLVRLAPTGAGWMYWNADSYLDDMFRWYADTWRQALPAERERIVALMLDQFQLPRRAAGRPEIRDLVTALGQVKQLAGKPEAWLELEVLQRLQQRPESRQPLVPVAMALLRCGAFEAQHDSSAAAPDPACWREVEARAPAVAQAGREWLTAILADPRQQPVYAGEKRLMPWLQALMLGAT